MKTHEVKFYCFVMRKSFIANNNFINVLRIICKNNQEINVKTGSKHPYTLTILPAFIQPYARRSTDIIINTIDTHINNPEQTKIQSAVQLGVENILSFNLYFDRVINRIDDWSINVIQKISEISGENNYERVPFETNNIARKWNNFMKLVDEYCAVLEKLKQRLVLLRSDRIVFIFVLLGMNLKSLGP